MSLSETVSMEGLKLP